MSRPRLLAAVALGALLAATPASAEGPAPQAVPFLGWGEVAPQGGPAERTTYESAATLGRGVLGIHAGLGFPFAFVEAGFGLADAFDLRLGLRTAYGATSQADLEARTRLFGTRAGLAGALALEAAYVFFQPDETALLLAGTRDFALAPALVVSLPVHDALLFGALGVQVAVDLDPPTLPLGGVPSGVAAFVNLPIDVGLELPLGGGMHFVSRLGLELRPGVRTPGEPVVLPRLSIGLDLTG